MVTIHRNIIYVYIYIYIYIIEIFWEQMPHSKDPPTTDDQNSINYCLDYMEVRWTNYNSSEKIENRSSDILGSVHNDEKSWELSVALLPFSKVCRHICDPNKRASYYVWHPLAITKYRPVAEKKGAAKLGGAWYLRDNWKELSDKNRHLAGTDWLQLISFS